MGKETSLRGLKTFVVWLALMLAVYLVLGFPNVLWFFCCAWCCFIIAGLTIVLWEERRGLWNKRRLLGTLDKLRNVRRWLADEKERLKASCQYEATKIEQPLDLQRFERSCERAFRALESANQRYKRALKFSISTTLILLFIAPFEQAAFCCCLLIMAPHFIQSTEESNLHIRLMDSDTIAGRFSLSTIMELSRRRETIANAVWAIAIALVIAMAIWGAFHPSGEPGDWRSPGDYIR